MMNTLTIKSRPIDHFMISEDTGRLDEPVAVVLYTPDMSNTGEHYHIDLSIKQSRDLRDWLTSFLATHEPTV